jgi:cytochrome c oxidase cbb3-type subunit IV
MDLNLLRIAVTVASLLLFVLLVLHTWSRRRAPEHEDAAVLPFLGEATPDASRSPIQGERGE